MSNFKRQSSPMPVHSNSDRLIGLHQQNKLFNKLRVIVIACSLFISSSTFAQREKIDSLKKVLPSLHDSARVDCLNELSGTYLEFTPSDRPENNLKIVDTAAYYVGL